MKRTDPPTMISFVFDLPNLCSLTGLFFALLSLFASAESHFAMSIIAMLWAVFFDWADGIVARKMSGRTNVQGIFGAQLDSLIDIVSFGACPAVFLMSYGEFARIWLFPAFLILASAAIRLAWFNVFGLGKNGAYTGLALDNNILVLAAVYPLKGILGPTPHALVLSVIFGGLCALNLAPVRTPKFGSRWFPALGLYCIVMTLIIARTG